MANLASCSGIISWENIICFFRLASSNGYGLSAGKYCYRFSSCRASLSCPLQGFGILHGCTHPMLPGKCSWNVASAHEFGVWYSFLHS